MCDCKGLSRAARGAGIFGAGEHRRPNTWGDVRTHLTAGVELDDESSAWK